MSLDFAIVYPEISGRLRAVPNFPSQLVALLAFTDGITSDGVIDPSVDGALFGRLWFFRDWFDEDGHLGSFS